MIRAVLFDFGGVITESPFDAFAAYERRRGLPVGTIRSINATNPDDNAWARLERSAISTDEFADAFAREAAAVGHRIDGRDVLALLAGAVRPEMVTVVRRCSERLRTACLTNNFTAPGGRSGTEPVDGERASAVAEAMSLFHHVVESRLVGVRKPDPEFYRVACEKVGIDPQEAVFLDDLGVNLKPAREMGMTTIKVTDHASAIDELEAVVGFSLR